MESYAREPLQHVVVGTTTVPSDVRKRDGKTIQPFDALKIQSAIRKAWLEAEGAVDELKLAQVSRFVANSLPAETADVERIQDTVEIALVKYNLCAVAKAYILYRHKRAEARQGQQAPDNTAISDYIHYGKYARYQPDLLRREVYLETAQRTRQMHLDRFAHLPEVVKLINWAFDRVDEKKVLPSMRSFQFAGKAIEVNNARIFNCSATFVDRPRVFAESLFLLLSGCGVGYSVQYEHVDKLPPLKFVDLKRVVHHVVKDTIEGWADALHALVMSYVEGTYLELSYFKIRAAGMPLKTSGGRAPGHHKLKEAFEHIRDVLAGAQGRNLRPIEAHDIMCFAADAVLSGGIRRSAMISLFSLEDSEMVYAKTGDWHVKHPWRANANNSVVLKRDEVKKKQFKRIFQMIRGWGEPGFFFTESDDHATNPCNEISLNPRLVVNADSREIIEKKGVDVTEIPDGKAFTGFAFCNLCEINAAKFTSLADFMEAARAATIIGTLQASYTSMPYLGWVSEAIAEREALLGIGMTGMLDAPAIACDPTAQAQVATAIKAWNQEFAAMIGIRAAARTTCVKPSGTTSLELGSVASGHHPHHAKRYIRRVTADELETVFQAFKAVNPHACVRKPDGKWTIEFPVQPRDGALVKDDFEAVQFLEMIKSTQQSWVLNGTARPESSPGLNHNVSNTVSVKPHEWEAVAEYLWENRAFFTGVSLLPASADKDYAYAPFEAVVTEADERRWNQLIANYKPVDYTAILELEDGTNLSGEAACAGGSCTLV